MTLRHDRRRRIGAIPAVVVGNDRVGQPHLPADDAIETGACQRGAAIVRDRAVADIRRCVIVADPNAL